LRARVANEIVATALLAESQGQQDNFASGMAMYRDVADSVTTAVRAHRRALGGGADAWWVFVSRVLPDSIKDLARALQQGKGESEGDGLREASRSASPDRDASAPPRAQDENRAPNTQDWTDTNAVLMEEQKRREKEAAIWGSLLRKEAGAAASCAPGQAPAPGQTPPAPPPALAADPAEAAVDALAAEASAPALDADIGLDPEGWFLITVRSQPKGTPVLIADDGRSVQVGSAAPLILPMAVAASSGKASWKKMPSGERYLELRFKALDVMLVPH